MKPKIVSMKIKNNSRSHFRRKPVFMTIPLVLLLLSFSMEDGTKDDIINPRGIAVVETDDWRNFHSGHHIRVKNYNDQPYVVITADNNWLCTMTTGDGREGDPGQHMVAIISKDKGKTWSEFIDIEPAGGPDDPTSSYGVPLVVPGGRVYVFYTYNGDNVLNFTASGQRARNDCLGWMVYRFSDDNGHTWSERYRIPMRITAADRENHFFSPRNPDEEPQEVQLFWGIDKPIVANGSVYFAFSKRGRGYAGEGFVYRSDNILYEKDPEKIRWELLPEGDRGIRDMEGPHIQDEHNIVALEGNGFYCMSRTDAGYPLHSYSRDGGKTWSTPVPATYSPEGRIIRHPRACPMLWQTSNGRYLFWYHNNGEPFKHDQTEELRQPISNRNLVWLTAGEEIDGYLHWSEPELIIYRPWTTGGPSYPDLIEQDGRFFITSGSKVEARVIEIDPELLYFLWRQNTIKEVARAGLILSADADRLTRQDGKLRMPCLPDLSKGKGFTLDLWLQPKDLAPGRIILDSRDESGKGIMVSTADNQTLMITLNDGAGSFSWDTDPGLLTTGQLHHVVLIVDGGPKMISSLVDGQFCDGGTDPFRPAGYGRFVKETRAGKHLDQDLGVVTGGPDLILSPEIRHIRIYDRYLLNTEAIGNFREGL